MSHFFVQINAGTWTTEQLMVATGYRPADRQLNTNASSRSQYPPPSPTDVWLAEHPLPLQSAYKTVLGAEPAFTSCHSKFIGTVDYVWFTPEVIIAIKSWHCPHQGSGIQCII